MTTADELAYLDETTGEIIEPDGAADLTVAALNNYASTSAELALVRMDLTARTQALVEADHEAAGLAQRMRILQARQDTVRNALDDVFSDDLRTRHGRGIVIDTGAVRVTYAKPTVRYTQRVKAKTIAKRDPALAAELGIERVVSKPSAPRIKVRAEVDE